MSPPIRNAIDNKTNLSEFHFRSHITYAEKNCSGSGSNKGRRVSWEKQLSAQEWNRYISSEFIDQEKWMEQQAP
jgi:hypothetical protein